MPALAALLLALAPAARAKTSVMSVDPGDPAYEATHGKDQAADTRKKGRKAAAGADSGGDVEVGPDMQDDGLKATPRKAPRAAGPEGSRVPGIFAVYDIGRRWMLLDRTGKARLAKGSRVFVIGARGLGEFSVERATRSYEAACAGSRHVARRGWLLTAKDAKLFKRVGVPVIGILLKAGSRFDARTARFSRMRNAESEDLYRKLEQPLKQAVAADLASGAYQTDPGDDAGRQAAANADLDKIRLKLDFASRVRAPGLSDPVLVVEGAEFSRSYRRCLLLVDGAKPVGPCVEMPHELMAETAALDFVAYAPVRGAAPFILAYTPAEPLWGRERWGFQTTPKGMRLFLRDALDPRCRDAF